jgi:hypothetical protein
MRSKRIVLIAAGTALLLLVPLAAMQFSGEMAWDAFDFAVAGVLVFGTGLAYELIAARGSNAAYRFAVGLALAATFLLIWMNLAVGLIGSENNPANLLYGGVLAVGIAGAIAARLKPKGMARTLFAMALVQALVPFVAMMIWKPPFTMGMLGVLGVNAIFVLLFSGSALLFRRAAGD